MPKPKLPIKTPEKVECRVLWFTSEDDPSLETYPELYSHLISGCELNTCTDILQLREQSEKNDLIFIDGGAVGHENIGGQGARHICIVKKIIEDLPNRQFIISGYAANRWKKDLYSEELPNVDVCCWSRSRDYINRWMEQRRKECQ